MNDSRAGVRTKRPANRSEGYSDYRNPQRVNRRCGKALAAARNMVR